MAHVSPSDHGFPYTVYPLMRVGSAWHAACSRSCMESGLDTHLMCMNSHVLPMQSHRQVPVPPCAARPLMRALSALFQYPRYLTRHLTPAGSSVCCTLQCSDYMCDQCVSEPPLSSDGKDGNSWNLCTALLAMPSLPPLRRLAPLLLVAVAASAINLEAISTNSSSSGAQGPLPPRPPVPPGSSLHGNRDAVLATGSDGRLFDTGERRGFTLYVRLGEAQVRARSMCVCAALPQG